MSRLNDPLPYMAGGEAPERRPATLGESVARDRSAPNPKGVALERPDLKVVGEPVDHRRGGSSAATTRIIASRRK